MVDFTLELESEDTAPDWARETVRGRFARVLGGETLLDLQLIVSELVTNSVRHGPGAPIELRLTLTDEGPIRGEVKDHGTGEIAIREIASDGGGFGLRLVDSLADRWGVYEGSTHVWFEMRTDRD
jgi:anti-sigma regulatory factor (Ser/Thr protein kinase)